MAFQFPNNPTIGQSVLNPTSSQYYTWNGTAWTQYPTSASYAISSSFAVTSSYAQNGGSGGSTITIGDNAPTGSAATTGSMWFNSTNMGLYVRYQDTDSTQWVAASAVGPISTASFATSASFTQTASFAQTASSVQNIIRLPSTYTGTANNNGGTYTPQGAGLYYDTTQNAWLADTVEGYANTGIAYPTPWGLTLFMLQSDQQFYWRNNTGTNKFGTRWVSYSRTSSGINSDLRQRSFWNLGSTNNTIWGDSTLSLTFHGDSEYMKITWANSQDQLAAGDFEIYECWMYLGSGYNNNYFRVKKLK